MTSSKLTIKLREIFKLHKHDFKSIYKLLNHTYIKVTYVTFIFMLISVVVVLGNQHVGKNVNHVYRVFVDNKEIGTVSNKLLIENYIDTRKKELEQKYPQARMILRTDLIELIPEQMVHLETNDNEVISLLDQLIQPKSVGVEINVDGKVVAIVRDQQTANVILDKIKEPYTINTQTNSKIKALSAETYYELNENEQTLENTEFVEKIDLNEATIVPEQVENPDEVLKRLKTGNVQPAKYTVIQGDCLSCIAQKFNLTTEFLYLKNPWLKNDSLQVGDVLDITELKPTISVKTFSRLEKDEEIRFPTEYVANQELRNGLIKPISPGKNGTKKVLYEITRVNGIVAEETVISENIIDQPVPAKAYRGTRIVLGQGSGRFIWPVKSPRITSTFGMRWGAFHKGIDITGVREIIVADNGKIEEAGFDSGGYGYHIVVDHMNGLKTHYAHLSKILVKAGTIVEKGEIIGIMGSTGHSTGVHLHFEIIDEGTAVNPLKFLNK
jgi:murein DD-endopeptidase MepM/ murein hydrolase activator NlpD